MYKELKHIKLSKAMKSYRQTYSRCFNTVFIIYIQRERRTQASHLFNREYIIMSKISNKGELTEQEQLDIKWNNHVKLMESRVGAKRNIKDLGTACAEQADGSHLTQTAKITLTNAVTNLIVETRKVYDEFEVVEPCRRYLSRVHNLSWNKAYNSMNKRLTKMKENFAIDPHHHADPNKRPNGNLKEDGQWRGEATRNLRNQTNAYSWFLSALVASPAKALKWAVEQRASGNLVEGIDKDLQTASLSARSDAWKGMHEDYLLQQPEADQGTLFVGSDPDADNRLYYPMPKNSTIHTNEETHPDEEGSDYFDLVLESDQGSKEETRLLREQWTHKRYHDYILSFSHMPGYLTGLDKSWETILIAEQPDEAQLDKCFNINKKKKQTSN